MKINQNHIKREISFKAHQKLKAICNSLKKYNKSFNKYSNSSKNKICNTEEIENFVNSKLNKIPSESAYSPEDVKCYDFVINLFACK